MNVIFLDFDGVLETIHYSSNEDIERRIKILADICKIYNCKVAIEATAKCVIDEETMEILNDESWVAFIFNCFKKYGIECIGRTPCIGRQINHYTYIPIWKEDEILSYLLKHPEIEHYCVIDDDDMEPFGFDLNMIRDHLVKTVYYSDNYEEGGLLEKHKEEVGKKLSLKRKDR